MNQFFEMMSHPFMLRALLTGILISLPAALIGVSLVLRKNAMIGDGLSHVAFSAFAVAAALGLTPLWFALPVSILASFMILRLGKSRRIDGDALIALISTSALAIGIIAISLAGINIDLNSYLFGSILAVSWVEVGIAAVIAIFTLVLYLFLHHRIFAITFDANFARAIGIKTEIYDAIFAIICSLVVVVGMKLLGALLISSLVIFPTLIAMRLTKSFKYTVIIATIEAVIAFVVGLALSYVFSLPTGATVVITHLAILILTIFCRI